MKTTKEQIIEQAISLFKTEGYENVSVDKICQACDVTKGSFYHHFASKNDILLNFYNSEYSYAMSMSSELLCLQSPKQQLWRVLEFSIDKTIDLGADLLKQLLILNILQGGNVLTQYSQDLPEVQEYNNLVMRLIEKGQEAGEIRNGSSSDLLFAYISGLLGVAMNWSASGGKYDEKQELLRLFEIIFAK